MTVSIIIPTYNGEKQLSNVLTSIISQNIKVTEIIVVDSSSTDRTVEIAKDFDCKILTILNENFDHGGTRSLAAQQAVGEIIVFLTQDAILANNRSLSNIITVFDDENIGAAYGRQLAYENASIFSSFIRSFNYPQVSSVKFISDKKKYGIKTAFLSDSFTAYRATILKQVDWFKESIIVGEDTYVGSKIILAGYGLSCVSDAEVYHSHNYSIMQEYKRYFDIGVFHRCENWILKEFGTAEGEGLRFIGEEIKYLVNKRAIHFIFELFVRNVAKYFGYKLGQNYKHIPNFIIIASSMHKKWWNKYDLGRNNE